MCYYLLVIDLVLLLEDLVLIVWIMFVDVFGVDCLNGFLFDFLEGEYWMVGCLIVDVCRS